MADRGRILLADDEETFLYSTADLLRGRGYHCDCAEDANVAARMLAAEPYDLLIADIKMPGNPDLELIRGLNRIAEGLSVILVTGNPSLDSAIDSIQLPVAAYMVKPIDFEELAGHCAKAIDQFRIQRAIAEAQGRLVDWKGELSGIEETFGRPAETGTPGDVNAFLSLTLRNITGSLSDLKRLTEALSMNNPSPQACQLLNCPRGDTLTAALEETVSVLEKTKSSFKSKDLAALRAKLEVVLQNG